MTASPDTYIGLGVEAPFYPLHDQQTEMNAEHEAVCPTDLSIDKYLDGKYWDAIRKMA